MLPKANRLPKEQIRVAFSAGKRVASPIGVFYILPCGAPRSRFAIAVGKTIIPLATKRNRTKRLIRNSLMLYATRLRSPTNFLLVIKKPLSTLSQRDVDVLLEEGLQKAHLL